MVFFNCLLGLEARAEDASMDDQEELLQELLSLHHLMLQWAEEGKWLDVAAVEKIRQEHLKTFFQAPISQDRLTEVRAALKTMLSINDKLMGLAKKSRGGLGQDISSIQKGRRALAAYGQNTASARQPVERAHSG